MTKMKRPLQAEQRRRIASRAGADVARRLVLRRDLV